MTSPRDDDDEVTKGQSAPHIRQHNRRLVMHVLRTAGPLSRRRISEATELQPATVTNIVAELIDLGLAHEIGSSRSRSTAGGRPQVLVDLKANAAHVGGIYVGIRWLYVSIGDIRGAALSRERLIRPASPEGIARVAASTLRRLGRGIGVPPEGLSAVGLAVVVGATPGVDPHVASQRLSEQLAAILEGEIGRPVVAESGPVAMTLAESLFGSVGDERCILVHVGTTVGAGVQWGHRLFGRSVYWHSAIGHCVIDPQGATCACGGRGCLDTIASERYLIERAQRAVDDGATTLLVRPRFDPRSRGSEAIAEAALERDEVALRLITDAADALGIAIANALQVLSADVAILAGPILTAGEALLGPLRARVAAQLAGSLGHAPRVLPTAFGIEAPFIAGLAIALDRAVFGAWQGSLRAGQVVSIAGGVEREKLEEIRTPT